MVEYLQPTAQHVTDVVEHLRAADRAELEASGHPDPRRAIELSLSLSTHMVAACAGGKCGALFGCAPASMLAGVGVPWMLGTDLVVTHRRALMADAPAYIRSMLHAYPLLVNHVHADNALAVRWLRRAGFTLQPAAPHGPRGALFHRFELRA